MIELYLFIGVCFGSYRFYKWHTIDFSTKLFLILSATTLWWLGNAAFLWKENNMTQKTKDAYKRASEKVKTFIDSRKKTQGAESE